MVDFLHLRISSNFLAPILRRSYFSKTKGSFFESKTLIISLCSERKFVKARTDLNNYKQSQNKILMLVQLCDS